MENRKVVWKDCKLAFCTPEGSGIRSDVSILTKGNTIAAVAPFPQLEREFGPDAMSWDIVDCRNKLVLPGLVDGHNHLCNTHMNLSRILGLRYDDIVEHMLATVHDPYGWLNEESLYDISLLSALNDIKHGATTIENSTILPDVAFRAMRAAGCRGILAPQMATSFRLESDSLSPREMLERTERSIREYHDPEHGMSVVVHIHDLWDTLEELMAAGMRLAEQYDTRYVSHFWEFGDAVRRSNSLWAAEGGAFSHYLNRGLINDRCVFFHGSMLTAEEIVRLAETGASVIHNPEINGTNCGNCAYIPAMLDAGVNVGVGSDYGSLDVLTAMKLSLLVHNIMPREKKGLAYRQPFAMATLGGARAYGLDGMIGSIEAGKRADLISFDLSHASELAPLCVSALDYSPEILFFLFTRNCAGLSTCDTMVDGRFLRRDGRFCQVDEAAVLEKANYWFERFLPDLMERLSQGRHYAARIYDDFSRDEDVPPEARL